jgi:hypothetical protein
MNPSEYDVAYSTKEWLINHRWRVIAFNPPGAQGAFSIPNPDKKEEGYKGQTGTEAPDIIAIKDNQILIVECKDFKTKEIQSDIEKLTNFFKNPRREELFIRIIDIACKANKVPFIPDKCNIILGKAHGGEALEQDHIETFHVKIEGKWDDTDIDPEADLTKTIKVDYLPTTDERKKILED